MKAFFDTSVLVAVFWEDHPQHLKSINLFHAAHKKDFACATHSLAEVYGVMTRLPVRPLLVPEQVMLFIHEIRQRLSLIALDGEDYYTTIEHMAEGNLSGGRIYDALLMRCAEKAKAETLYTWNLKHFQDLALNTTVKIKTP